MGIAAEKSGIKLKIPPDDYVKSERSKSGFKKGDKKKKEPKPNLQKEWVFFHSIPRGSSIARVTFEDCAIIERS